jgi:parallel beta-helix repeat protein
VEPSTAPIQRIGETFTLTGNISDSIFVERDSIVLDGAGYSLIGSGSGDAVNLLSSDVVVTGLHLENWTAGIVGFSHNNTIAGNVVTHCYSGIRICADDYVIVGNNITGNSEGLLISGNQTLVAKNNVTDNKVGFRIYYLNHTIVDNNIANSVQDIYAQWAGTQTFHHNNFLGNGTHIYDSTRYDPNDAGAPTVPAEATWDDGEEGNFWSDYDGEDANRDGIGDTPYVVETPKTFTHGNLSWTEGTNAQDNYPLKSPWNNTYVDQVLPAGTSSPSSSPSESPRPSPSGSSAEPSASSPEQDQPTPVSPYMLMLAVFASVAIAAVFVTALQRVHRKIAG